MIHITSLYKKYGKDPSITVALENINLNIEMTEMVAITGTSGAGKTTLINIIAGLETYSEGSVTIDGMELKNLSRKKLDEFRSKKFGIVMQHYSLIDDFTVLDNVCLPLLLSNSKHTKKECLVLAKEVLTLVGMESSIHKYVNQLSGGEMQRVAIARAIIGKPNYILADEPTGALDHKNSINTIKLLKQINNSGVGVIVVTHDTEIAQMCNRIIKIDDGRIV